MNPVGGLPPPAVAPPGNYSEQPAHPPVENPVMMNRSPQSPLVAAWPALIASLALTASAPARAENFARGQELYDHHCQSCHEDLMHARNRKLKTLDALRSRIRDWASHTGNTWSAEDVDDVLYYLNKSFYHFDQKPL